MKSIASPTENIPNQDQLIDKMSKKDRIIYFLEDHEISIRSVKKIIPEIEHCIEEIVKKINKSGLSKIIYIGAGTSGRIGMMDSLELYPTFSWPENRTFFLLAGGKKSLISPVENAEDNIDAAIKEIKMVNNINRDVVIAISASGNTPFTVEALKEAKKRGALTVGIANNKNSFLLQHAKIKLFLDTGGEVIAGSTRLKAGTSQKICLNLISSLVMISLGKVKDGRMINLKPMNNKLRQRMKGIERYLLGKKL